MGHFIRDVRKELDEPKLPFVIGVMGVNGPVGQYRPDQKRYAATHQNFRDAMAAPASLPEFAGNVTAVLTEQYWDMELSALRARDANVKREAKELSKQRPGQEADAIQTKLREKEFTASELAILEKGVSNAEYHYLGSAKIIAQIGKGFAEALVKP
jgi:hypothetical protein